jgi:transcriptional regulator with XRE-family HTH domain
MTTFGTKIKILRTRRGLSQRALARALKKQGIEISQRAISAWEDGANPRPEMAAESARFFGVPVDDLVDDTKPCPKDGLASYLEELQSWREEAEKKYSGNKAAISEAIEKSKFASAFEVSEMALRNERARLARELRKLADSIDPPKKEKS